MEKENLAETIKNEVKDNNVFIYSKSYCPYCKKAKSLFEKLKGKKFFNHNNKKNN